MTVIDHDTAAPLLERDSTELLPSTAVPMVLPIWEKVGCHYLPPHDYEVGREQIREFARAIHDDHPAHRSEQAAAELGYRSLVAPVTFASVIGTRLLPELFEHLLIGYRVSDVLHTDQQLILHRPMLVGDVLHSDLSLESFRQAAGSDVMVTTNTMTDAYGKAVLLTRTTFVARTGGFQDARIDAVLAGVMRS